MIIQIKDKTNGKIIDSIKDKFGKIIYEAWKRLTVSGIPPLTLLNCKGINLIDYKIFGNSIQNGTPSTANPIGIQSVGDKTSNIVDLSKTVVSSITPHVKFSYDNSNSSLELTSTPTTYDYTVISSKNLGLEVGKTYYYGGDIIVSGKKTTNDTRIAFGLSGAIYPTLKFFENETRHVEGTFAYTGQESISLRMFFNYGSIEPANVTFKNVYINEVKNEYEPYGKYKIPITVEDESGNKTTKNINLEEPLRKVGNYVDYIDFANKKIYRNVEVIDNSGTLTIEESLRGLTTPIEEEIELPNIPTLKGTTILEVDTTIQPSNLEVVYKGK